MNKHLNHFFQNRTSARIFWFAVIVQIILVAALYFKDIYIQNLFTRQYDNPEARASFGQAMCVQLPKCKGATVQYIFDTSVKPGHYAVLVGFTTRRVDDVQSEDVIRILDHMTSDHSWLFFDRFIEYQFVGHPELTYRHGKA